MYQAALTVLSPFLSLSQPPFSASVISPTRQTNTGPQVQPISPDPTDHHPPPPLLPDPAPSKAARLCEVGFLGTSSPWKSSLPPPPVSHSGKPAGQWTVPGTLRQPAAVSGALCEGGAQPAATPSQSLPPPPSCPQPSARPGPPLHAAIKSANTEAKAPVPTNGLPLLTFWAQKCGPGSPLAALGGATDSWLVSEEFRLSDSTAP